MRGWRAVYHATGSQKKAGVAILLSDKLDFKLKAVTRDEERALYNNYRVYPSGRANNYKCVCAKYGSPQIYKTITNKSNLIDKNVVIAGDFNTPLTVMDHLDTGSIKKQGP